MLTATDVEQKTFSTALRGYDLDEVDDFLDEIVGTLRELNDQLEEARTAGPAPAEPVTTPEPRPEPEPEPEPVAEPGIDESAIGRALVAAQTAADQLLADARIEADSIVDEAKGEADTWRSERDAKKAEAESEIAALAARVSSIRAELAVLAGEVSEKLDEMDAVIEGDGEAETGQETSSANGETSTEVTDGDADQLDDILNGVAADLQLDSDEGSEVPTTEDQGGSEDTDEKPDSGTSTP
jgi:DivIVA domain-containing protein